MTHHEIAWLLLVFGACCLSIAICIVAGVVRFSAALRSDRQRRAFSDYRSACMVLEARQWAARRARQAEQGRAA